MFSYDVICEKIEDLMQSYVESKCQYSFATFIVTTLLHRTNQLNLVEQELFAIYATVLEYKEQDSVIAVYYDFLTDTLKGDTHLSFYFLCQRIIS